VLCTFAFHGIKQVLVFTPLLYTKNRSVLEGTTQYFSIHAALLYQVNIKYISIFLCPLPAELNDIMTLRIDIIKSYEVDFSNNS
jgi:hypothetical protein